MLAGLAGCAPARAPQGAAARDTAAVRTLTRTYDRWIVGMASDSIAAAYTPEGVMVATRDTLARGPEAIAKFLHGFDGRAQVLSDTSLVDSIAFEGERAIVTGVYHQHAVVLPERREVFAQGRFRAQWVHTEQEGWLLESMQTTPLN